MAYDFANKKWDSDFFKFQVADIFGAGDADSFKFMIQDLILKRYQLAYWKIASNDVLKNQIAREMKLYLADTKVSFISNLNLNHIKCNNNIQIEKFDGKENEDVFSLMLQSGEFSRFRTDQNFPKGTFEKLYKTWILKAIESNKASKIFISKQEEHITGFVNINAEKTTRVHIDHIAVDNHFRRSNIGLQLMQKAMTWAAECNYCELQVATQKINKGACDFYIACGFKKMKEENIFHIWLRVNK